MSAGHEYGEEVYYGDGGDDKIPQGLSEAKLPAQVQVNDDSEVDEEELQDQVDADDPPLITVQFEIQILSVREILMKDGTQLFVKLVKGAQISKTNTKLLKENRVIFKQKVMMKTTLAKEQGQTKYGRKDVNINLVREDDNSVLGEACLNLASYYKCMSRTEFSVELTKSQFPEAVVVYSILATPQINGKANSATAKN